MRRSMFRAATVAVTLTALALVAPPAYAGHGGKIIGPDNLDQAVKGSNLTTRGKLAMNHGKAQLERSKINVSTGGGDIYVRDGKYGDTGRYGRMWCSDTDGGDCNVYQVTFNVSLLPSTDYAYRAVGCHEIGHTGTLGHRYTTTDTDDNSCMRKKIYQEWAPNLDSHDVNAINNNA